MKKLVLLFAAVCPLITLAQDKIITKKGETIAAKVLEISPNEVKYKKADNLKGPTYIAQKAELQAIEYENGTKEEMFTATLPKEISKFRGDYVEGEVKVLTRDNVREILKNDEEAYKIYRKSRGLRIASNIASGSSLGFIAVAIALHEGGIATIPEVTVPISIATGLLPGIILGVSSSNRFDQAVNTYNRNQQKNITLSPIIGTNTIGIAVKF